MAADMNKQFIAKKIISSFLYDNEQRYLNKNNDFIEYFTMNDIISEIEGTYKKKTDFKQDGKWKVITEAEYDYLKRHSNKKEKIKEGMIIEGEAWISSPTLQIAYNELADEKLFYKDDEGRIRYSIEKEDNKTRLHPVLNIASKIDVKTTKYKHIRVLLVDKQFSVSISKWLNDEFERDGKEVFCVPIENALIIFSSFDADPNPNKTLDNYLKKLLKENNFRVI